MKRREKKPHGNGNKMNRIAESTPFATCDLDTYLPMFNSHLTFFFFSHNEKCDDKEFIDNFIFYD